MEDVLELKFDYEDTGRYRTYYKGKYKGKTYFIVIIHLRYLDNICTASRDGEPNCDLKPGIPVKLNGKMYRTTHKNGYAVLERITE